MAKINYNYWIAATRPKTLPAGFVPVILGSSIAFADGKFNLFLAIITLICSTVLQIISNFVNEIYDYTKGTDSTERLGPKRMVASGFISVDEMTKGTIILACVAALLGTVIICMSDLWVLLIGVAALAFAWMYTGGPYPLSYHGLGDLFVFIFFGIIAVNGSYYVQTLSFSPIVLLASIATGFLSMNILGVNNFRDIDTDPKSGKLTLSSMLGHDNCIIFYEALCFGAFCVPIVLAVVQKNWFNLLPLLAIPLGLKLINEMKTFKGEQLNKVLAGSGQLVLIHGILSSLGFILYRII